MSPSFRELKSPSSIFGGVVLRLAEYAGVGKPVGGVGDHVHLHGGLPLPVLCPVNAPERQLNRRGVYCVDAA